MLLRLPSTTAFQSATVLSRPLLPHSGCQHRRFRPTFWQRKDSSTSPFTSSRTLPVEAATCLTLQCAGSGRHFQKTSEKHISRPNYVYSRNRPRIPASQRAQDLDMTTLSPST